MRHSQEIMIVANSIDLVKKFTFSSWFYFFVNVSVNTRDILVPLINFRIIPCSCDGLMLSALNAGTSGPGLSPGQGHCVVFLGKTLYSLSASLHPGV